MTELDYGKIDPIWDSGNYVLMDGINDHTCLQAIRFIQYHNMNESDLDHLTIVVNSPGGSVSAAFALIDTMRTSRIPVHTLAIGEIASCGVLITMSGAKGFRRISENCLVMSHQYSWGAQGKHSDLMASRRGQDLVQRLLLKHYRKCTKLSEKRILSELMPHHDVWLDAEEARNYGIVDEVVEID